MSIENNKLMNLADGKVLYDDLRGRIDDKLDIPSVAGTSGQVLTSDGNGGQSWQDPSGGGGTSDYSNLTNKPSINSVSLSGNKSTSDLGIHDIPSGGASGKILKKASGTDYDLEWGDAPTATDEQVETAVDAWLDENITNPSNPPLDRSLSSSSAAAPADLVGDLLSALKSIIYDENLFDASTAIDDKRINASGTLQNDPGVSYTSDFIPVLPNAYYSKNSPILDIRHRIAVYDSAKNFIQDQLFELNLIKTPSTGAYVRFCGLLTEKSTAKLLRMSAKDSVLKEEVDQIEDDNKEALKNIENEIETIEDDYKNKVALLTNDKQLWNPFDIVYGKLYYCNGTEVANDDYCCIDVPVSEGVTYYFNSVDPTTSSGIKTGTAGYICPVKNDDTYYYDTASAVTWVSNYTVPDDSNITHMIVSLPLSRLDSDHMYSIASSIVSSTRPYSPRFSSYFNTVAEKVELNNILTGATWESGYVSQVYGTVTQNDSYITTDFIPVTGGKYIVSCKDKQRCEIFSLAVYTSNDATSVIAGANMYGDGKQGQTGYFKLPSNAAYVKITYRTSVYDSSIFVYTYDYNVGYISQEFYKIKTSAMPDAMAMIEDIKNGVSSKWKGKKFLAIGDSQTAQNRWEPLVESALGMTAYIQGFAGRTMAVRNLDNKGDCISSNYNIGVIDTYIADGHDDFDVVLIMGGTNDWNYDGAYVHEVSQGVYKPGSDYCNILIGTNEGETDDTGNAVNKYTFKGALKKLVKHFKVNYPTKMVVLMSLIGGRALEPSTDMDHPESTILTNMTSPIVNANGYTQASFADATRELAEYLGVPYIAVFDCGITIYNSASCLADGLHINTGLGAKLVANAVINGLQGLQPYNE